MLMENLFSSEPIEEVFGNIVELIATLSETRDEPKRRQKCYGGHKRRVCQQVHYRGKRMNKLTDQSSSSLVLRRRKNYTLCQLRIFSCIWRFSAWIEYSAHTMERTRMIWWV